ncbi:replication/maintenance protein RepL, partial [Avibacterium avium]
MNFQSPKKCLFLSFQRFIMALGSSKKGVKMSLQRYETNPFLQQMTIPVKDKRVQISRLGRDDNVLVNQNTGEILGTHVTTFKRVDSEQFVKLFTANIGLTFDLSSSGIKAFNVLLWAVQNQALAKDQVLLDSMMLDDFLKDYGNLKLSYTTLKRGINELEKAQIIAKTMRKGFYFINPNFVFNGDRIAFTTLIERKRQDQPEQIDLVETIEQSKD